MLWKNPSTLAGFEPVNLRSSGEYNNHGTTKNPGKNLNQENWSDRGSNPGPLGERQWCYPLTTVVVLFLLLNDYIIITIVIIIIIIITV